MTCFSPALTAHNHLPGISVGPFKRNQTKHNTEEHGQTHVHGVTQTAMKRAGNETTGINKIDDNFTQTSAQPTSKYVTVLSSYGKK